MPPNPILKQQCPPQQAQTVHPSHITFPTIIPVNRDLPVGSRAEVEPGNFSLIVSLIGSTKNNCTTIGVFSISEIKI
jgi:hypothetical protein